MIIGEGPPLQTFPKVPAQAAGQEDFPPLSSFLSQDILDISPDALGLDQEGQEIFKSIQQGVEDLRTLDIELAEKRLSALRDRLSITSRLEEKALPGYKGGFLQDVRSIGRELNNIGRQIGFFLGDSAEFRNISRIDFSYLRAVSSETSLELEADDDGIEVTAALEQTEIISSTLRVSQNTSLSFSDFGPLTQSHAALIKVFTETITDFNSFAARFF